MNKESSTELTFQMVTWDQYFNAIVRERAYHTVEEYNVQTSYGQVDESDPMEIKDSTYRRDFVQVVELEDPSKQVRGQLMSQLNHHGIDPKDHHLDFEGSLFEATMEALDNFVDLDSCVLVELGDNSFEDQGQTVTYKNYMLAPTTCDELILKMLDFTRGCLIVYMPKKFTMFSVRTA